MFLFININTDNNIKEICKWNFFVFIAPASDDCETAYQFVKCSYQTNPEYFFFP